MNSIDEGTASIGRPRKTTSPEEGHEWTCPYCGASRLNTTAGEGGRKNATVALRTHIFASDGDEHGPRNELPPGEALRLSEHVSRVEDRR